jgi:hypothetical protein
MNENVVCADIDDDESARTPRRIVIRRDTTMLQRMVEGRTYCLPDASAASGG